MKRLLLLAVLVILTVVAGACGQSPAPLEEQEGIRIEVSRNGFNGKGGEFRIEVEEGQEVEITFVYGDDDFPQNNPHIIEFPDLGVKTGTIDRDNLEETVRFTAGETGEVRFLCTLTDCVGHANLVRGMMHIEEEGHGHTEEEAHD